jgi:superfamily II DNA or RNA helicase
MQNIRKHQASPGLVYSQFVSGEGLGVFARVLEALGYEPFGADANEYDLKKKTKKYAVLSGDIDPEDRVQLIQQFNQPENKHGDLISLLLVSSAVAEGIDLKRIRHVHIIEPFWNYARVNQVITRAVRYMSHEDLPENERNVQPYVYLSTYPKDYPKSKIKEPTTDVDLYKNSIGEMHIIDKFILALAESSIDCGVHHDKLDESVKEKITCRLCKPTGKQLYHPLLSKDLLLGNTCEQYSEEKIKVNEITIEATGEKVYYRFKSADDVELFSFNKKLNGFAPMSRSNKYYGSLVARILAAKG